MPTPGRRCAPGRSAPAAPVPVSIDEVPLGSILPLWRWLRRRSAAVGFRAAVDSLRPHSHLIWQDLPEVEQRRFMRHARPWWDVHRHRIAPQVAEQLRDLVAAGRLEIGARIAPFRPPPTKRVNIYQYTDRLLQSQKRTASKKCY